MAQEPQRDWIISGQSKSHHSHPGNKELYEFIDNGLDSFDEAPNRTEYSRAILEELQGQGRQFYEQLKNGTWEQLSQDDAVERVRKAYYYRLKERNRAKQAAEQTHPNPETIPANVTPDNSENPEAKAVPIVWSDAGQGHPPSLPSLDTTQDSRHQAPALKRRNRGEDDDRRPQNRPSMRHAGEGAFDSALLNKSEHLAPRRNEPANTDSHPVRKKPKHSNDDARPLGDSIPTQQSLGEASSSSDRYLDFLYGDDYVPIRLDETEGSPGRTQDVDAQEDPLLAII